MSERQKGFLAVACLLVVAAFLFCWNLGSPPKVSFDEFHYIPAAREFLALNNNRNYEHPPLAKYFIATGMAVFGDNPIGWRAASVVFGLLTLASVYAAAWAIFGAWPLALVAGVLALVNGTLFVQSRIAMLDTFLAAFLLLACAALAWFVRWATSPVPVAKVDRPKARRALYVSGLAIGLATACKWFGLIPWAFMGVGVLVWAWRARGQKFPPIRVSDVYLALALLPALVYAGTYLPLFLLKSPPYNGLADLVKLHGQMWAGQRQVGTATHGYASPWYEWPFLVRPIWYFWEMDPQKVVIGQICLGNPLLMWGGLVAIGYLARRWWRERRWEDFALVATWAVFALSWGLLPRKLGFYYYYYPASLVLCLAVAATLRSVRQRWLRWTLVAASIGLFAFDYPILAAAPTTYESAMRRIWFRHWI